MFDLNFGKLLLLAVIALIVIGPKRLPKAARMAGAMLRRARHGWESVRAEVEREIQMEEIKRATREAAAQAEEVRAATESAAGDTRKVVDDSVAEVRRFTNTDATVTEHHDGNA